MSGSVRSRSLRRLPLTAASLVTGAYNAATRGQLYVHNLHWSITPGGLFSYFGRFGKVQGVHLPIDMKTGLSKGFGWVLMADKNAVITALAQKNHNIGIFNICASLRQSLTKSYYPDSHPTSNTTRTSDTLASVGDPSSDQHTSRGSGTPVDPEHTDKETESSFDAELPDDGTSVDQGVDGSEQSVERQEDIMGSSVDPPLDDAVDELVEYAKYYQTDHGIHEVQDDPIKGTNTNPKGHEPADN